MGPSRGIDLKTYCTMSVLVFFTKLYHAPLNKVTSCLNFGEWGVA